MVFGVPEAEIVNAAFTCPGPHGARFSTAKRGAWYAGLQFETSVAEVAFHRRRFLQNVRNQKFHGRQTFDYVDFLADFSGKFHRLDQRNSHPVCRPGRFPPVIESLSC